MRAWRATNLYYKKLEQKRRTGQCPVESQPWKSPRRRTTPRVHYLFVFFFSSAWVCEYAKVWLCWCEKDIKQREKERRAIVTAVSRLRSTNVKLVNLEEPKCNGGVIFFTSKFIFQMLFRIRSIRNSKKKNSSMLSLKFWGAFKGKVEFREIWKLGFARFCCIWVSIWAHHFCSPACYLSLAYLFSVFSQGHTCFVFSKLQVA